MGFYLKVAWRNLARHRRRTMITASAMAVAIAMCMFVIALNDGTYAQLFEVMVEQQLGHVQVHNPAYPGKRVINDTISDADALMERIDALPTTRAAAGRLNGMALVGGSERSAGALLRGVDPAREKAVTGMDEKVVDGSWLPDEANGSVLLGTGLAKDLEVGVGDEVIAVTQAADGSLGNALYTVAGTLRTGSTELDQAGAVFHVDDLQELLVLPDQLHEVILLGDVDAELYVEQVRGVLPPEGAEAKTWWEASPTTAEMMQMRDASAVITLGIVFAVAGFGMLNTMLMSVYERTRELGVLKAIGLRPSRLLLLVITESFLLGLVAAVLGGVLGGILDAWLVIEGIDLTPWIPDGISFAGVNLEPVIRGKVRAEGIIMTLTAVVLVSVGGSILPAVRAAMLRPIEAMRQQD
jgi:ABC-type lipoprotein release transport system permease subunit